jgi:hypothetical protein
MSSRLSRLGDDGDATVAADFAAWRGAAAQQLDQPATAIAASGDGLDRALRELAVREQAEARRRQALQLLLDHLSDDIPAAPELAPLEEAASVADAAQVALRGRLGAAEQSAARQRQAQVQLTDQWRSLQALAQLALQHLGPSCPVCDQVYDRDATKVRLEEMLRSGPEELPLADQTSEVGALAEEVALAQIAARQASDALRDAREAHTRVAAWRAALVRFATDAGIAGAIPSREAVSHQAREAESRVSAIHELRLQGETLSLGLARLTEAARRQELEQRLAEVDLKIATQTFAIRARNDTGDVATQLINALRDASGALVGKELQRIEPLLQRVFATMDPHPSFRAVSFLTKASRGKGQLWTALDDHVGDVRVQDPSLVLSSSQLNVLAVAVFLAFNLAIPTLPLQVVALDDPLQSLDTVNLLGLADLLRRVKATRQVIVSTHDERLAKLLERKLRPVESGQRTVRIDLQGWSTHGPTAVQVDVEPDVTPLRLVSAG